MGPIEVYFSTIALFVMIVGLIRGYAKELGSTIIIMTAIFLLTFVEDMAKPAILTLGRQVFEVAVQDVSSQNMLLSTAYTVIFIVIVLAGYAGRTLDFMGKPPSPVTGSLMSLAIGLLNGYLIAGTLWFYQDKYDYPSQALGIINPVFSDTAKQMIDLLPQYVMPSPTYWMLPIAILLIIRVRG